MLTLCLCRSLGFLSSLATRQSPLLLLAVFLILLSPLVTRHSSLLLAQTESASVSGRVTDQSNAVVPDVEVEIRNTDTGVTQLTKTNGEGFYSFPSVQPGNYVMSVRKQSFQTVSVTGITLHVQDNLSRNFVLQVGSSAVSVTVTADQNNINTTDAAVSTVVDQSYVKNMPLNGRSFQDLILLTPGVVTQTPQLSGVFGTGLGESGEFSVNGQRTESNGYTVDGVSANVGAAAGFGLLNGAGPSGSVPGATALGSTQALVSVDDLQEFRVQSSSYSAEYGRNPGGQFAFETKSGTNQWHGTAYDYLRNDLFDANDWFNDYLRATNPTLTKPALRQNDFGGTLGGPVRIPSLYNGKDRTFFFVSYEGLRLVQPQAATTVPVPDLCMRGVGPCPSYVNSSGQTIQRMPAASALLPVIDAFPLPTPNGFEDPVNGIGQFIGSWSNPASLDSTSVRLDHTFKDKVRFFFRFSDTSSNSNSRGSPVGGEPPTINHSSAYTMRTYTSGVTSILTNGLSNDFRLNYTSNEVANGVEVEPLGGSKPVNLLQMLGLGPRGAALVLLIQGPYASALDPGEESGAQRQWNLLDTVGHSWGRHQFKFGVDYRRLMPFAVPVTLEAPFFYFSESAIENNSAFTDPSANAPAYPLYTNFSAFAQDEWRASPRMNLSFGLRWDVNPAPSVTQGSAPSTLRGSTLDTLTLAPQGTPLWKTTWFNFAPRLGVAYTLRNAPGHETVLRAGGGVFFDSGQQMGSLGFEGPGFSSFGGFAPTLFPQFTPPPPIMNPPSSANVVSENALFAFPPHLQLPYTLGWNASAEQALGRSQALTVSYVGSHASRLLQTNHYSPPNNSNTSLGFYLVENGLTSDYDALQAQFRRRLSRGLTALASYTWSHCSDYGSQNDNFAYQRASCDFDVRHNFSGAFSYDLPSAGHNGLANALLSRWGLDNRFTARTSFPVTLNGGTLVDPITGKSRYAGLDLVSGQPLYLYGANCTTILQGLGDLAPGQGCPGGRAINPNAFAGVPTDPNTGNPTRLGTAPRNFARGFGAWQMDFAVRREFPIHERLKLQFRAEAFNVFNHPNFGLINPNFGQSTFGQATQTLAQSLGILSPLYQMGGPRSMQFALRVLF